MYTRTEVGFGVPGYLSVSEHGVGVELWVIVRRRGTMIKGEL